MRHTVHNKIDIIIDPFTHDDITEPISVKCLFWSNQNLTDRSIDPYIKVRLVVVSVDGAGCFLPRYSLGYRDDGWPAAHDLTTTTATAATAAAAATTASDWLPDMAADGLVLRIEGSSFLFPQPGVVVILIQITTVPLLVRLASWLVASEHHTPEVFW